MTQHPLGNLAFGNSYCKACGDRDPKACEGVTPFFDSNSCAEADELRNCIYAAYGNPFKKPKWQKHFAKEPWYKPNPAFDESMLSKVARQNVTELKKLGCTAVRAKANDGTPAHPLNERGGWSLREDLDGDGMPESIEAEKAQLRVGERTTETGLESWDYENGDIFIVDLDRSDKLREVAILRRGDDDYAETTFYRYADGKLWSLGAVENWVQPGELAGDGTVSETSGQCGVTLVVRYAIRKGELQEIERNETGKREPDCEESACPHVFVAQADGRFRYVGEILRDLVGSSARARQALPLAAADAHDGKIVVRISERESETTFLDDIYLSVGGVRVAPSACAAGPSPSPPAECVSDGLMRRLEYGDDLLLEFMVGRVPHRAEVTLWGTGYYVRR
ncbi:MAG: YARHG domain-containing protein [Kofleriaceae bacterium]|nr:YARHG domain-containing protein [Kofleriaceae bacterium]